MISLLIFLLMKANDIPCGLLRIPEITKNMGISIDPHYLVE